MDETWIEEDPAGYDGFASFLAPIFREIEEKIRAMIGPDADDFLFASNPRTYDRLVRHGVSLAIVRQVAECSPVDGAKFARELLAMPAGKIAELNAAGAAWA